MAFARETDLRLVILPFRGGMMLVLLGSVMLWTVGDMIAKNISLSYLWDIRTCPVEYGEMRFRKLGPWWW